MVAEGVGVLEFKIQPNATQSDAAHDAQVNSYCVSLFTRKSAPGKFAHGNVIDFSSIPLSWQARQAQHTTNERTARTVTARMQQFVGRRMIDFPVYFCLTVAFSVSAAAQQCNHTAAGSGRKTD
jgi:hypothetical protein